MCSKCDEIDVNIERCRRLMAEINDQQTRGAAAILLEELELRKLALHPGPSVVGLFRQMAAPTLRSPLVSPGVAGCHGAQCLSGGGFTEPSHALGGSAQTG
jgi:hypothetical protein